MEPMAWAAWSTEAPERNIMNKLPATRMGAALVSIARKRDWALTRFRRRRFHPASRSAAMPSGRSNRGVIHDDIRSARRGGTYG